MGNEPATVTRTHQFILSAVPPINKYPRDKAVLLERASLEVNLLRHMLRLAPAQ